MERSEELIQEIRNGINELQEFLRNFSITSLQSPMPRRAYYTTPEVMDKASQLLDKLRKNAVELQGEIEDLHEDLEDLENSRR